MLAYNAAHMLPSIPELPDASEDRGLLAALMTEERVYVPNDFNNHTRDLQTRIAILEREAVYAKERINELLQANREQTVRNSELLTREDYDIHHERLSDAMATLEERVRLTEQWQWKRDGAIVVLGVIFGTIFNLIFRHV